MRTCVLKSLSLRSASVVVKDVVVAVAVVATLLAIGATITVAESSSELARSWGC